MTFVLFVYLWVREGEREGGRERKKERKKERHIFGAEAMPSKDQFQSSQTQNKAHSSHKVITATCFICQPCVIFLPVAPEAGEGLALIWCRSSRLQRNCSYRIDFLCLKSLKEITTGLECHWITDTWMKNQNKSQLWDPCWAGTFTNIQNTRPCTSHTE